MPNRASKRIGKKVKCTGAGDKPYWAYVPLNMPPGDLRLELFQENLEKASQAIGRLDGIATVLPDTQLFLYMYVRKEAVLSSQIEGTQSSLSDLLLFESDESPGVPLNDVQEVSNYVSAMNHGLMRLRKGLPISLRLIKELHDVLISGTRGGTKSPGNFRKSQNWIGGSKPENAIFIPPPPNEVIDCMHELEKYIHNREDQLPLLVRTALIHHQFETIHPFLDGNGRVGRLLITLLLCSEEVLTEPILYLSLYFKRHRKEYYAQLQDVREKGTWENWINFFLEGVAVTAKEATNTAKEILSLVQKDRLKISDFGKGAGSALRVHQYLEKKPLAVIPEMVDELGLTTPTITMALKNLQSANIVKEITGKQRGKIFVYDKYLKIIEKGT